jgi:hypothetical protein
VARARRTRKTPEDPWAFYDIIRFSLDNADSTFWFVMGMWNVDFSRKNDGPAPPLGIS